MVRATAEGWASHRALPCCRPTHGAGGGEGEEPGPTAGAGAVLGHQGVSEETETKSWNTRQVRVGTTAETQVMQKRRDIQVTLTYSALTSRRRSVLAEP